LIDEEYQRLAPFRRALTKEQQECFDSLFRHAKLHRPAGVLQAAPLPMESILLSMLLEHERMLQVVLKEIRRLSEAITASDQRVEHPDGDRGLAF